MSLFGAKALKPVDQVKRKEVRTSSPSPLGRPSNGTHPNPPHSSSVSARQPAARAPPKPPALEDRYNMSHSAKKPLPVRKTQNPQKMVVRTSQKRKSETPQPPPLSSDSEGDEEPDLGAQETLRIKRPRIGDQHRSLRNVDHWPSDTDATPATLSIIHSRDLTAGPDVQGFKPMFPMESDAEVEIQYPSHSAPERYAMRSNRHRFRFDDEHGYDGYNSLDDMRRMMSQVLEHYLPPSQTKTKMLGPAGLEYSLSPTRTKKKLAEIRATIVEFNELVLAALKNGSFAKAIDKLETPLPYSLMDCITSQIYVRTVSPSTDALRRYPPGSDNTYGELKPNFCKDIFHLCGLNSKSTFLDLGSGVGNVVVQAALETGCAAYGVESMHEWHVLGQRQVTEFEARSRLWGLSHGPVKLIEGDFLDSDELGKLYPLVDVIIVNNFKFSAETNDALKLHFLSLKEGAKVVSLRNFVSGELSERNVNDVGNQFDVERKESSTNAVSWEADSVEYFIATKDSGRIERWQNGRKRGGR